MGQLVKPDQVAAIAAYMLGPESGVMTGVKGTKRVLDVGLRECPLDFRCMRAVALKRLQIPSWHS
jgi:hypothetical protein